MTAERWVPIVEVSEAGLPDILEHRKRVGSFSLGWSKLQTVSPLMSSHSQKSGQLLSLFLSPPPTWVSSVDDHKVELVSFSSVVAVMDLVFLALDQGLAKVSQGPPNVLSSVGWVSIFLVTTGSCFKNPSEPKNCRFQVLFGRKGKSESKNCWIWLFQKLQRTGSFLERTGNEPAVVQAHLIFLKKFENPGDISRIRSVGFLRTVVMNPKNTALIIRGWSIPVFVNRPMLVLKFI